MTIISYAQNFEDVMLHRALRDVPTGTYIDVGAHDPHQYSVTKHFYEHGWRGINVEPVREYFDALVAARPDDVNLNVAAGAARGTMRLFVIPGTGLSTSVEAHATMAASRGYPSMPTEVPVETLDQICERLRSSPVHFLKIDVEGAEGDVLRGMSFTSTRPWIVVVEATQPGTPQESYQEWEPILLDHRYAFAYFDGLNRFYVAQEQAQRIAAFDVPPNVFDEILPARQRALEQELSSVREELGEIDRWIAAVPPTDAGASGLDRIDRLKARFAGLINLSNRLAHERTMATDSLDASREDIHALNQKIQDRERNAEALKRELELLKDAHRLVIDERDRHAIVRGALETEIAGIRDRIAALEQVQEDRRAAVTALERELVGTHSLIQAQESARANAEASLSETRARMARQELEFYTSRSWRITAPLRTVMRWLRSKPKTVDGTRDD